MADSPARLLSVLPVEPAQPLGSSGTRIPSPRENNAQSAYGAAHAGDRITNRTHSPYSITYSNCSFSASTFDAPDRDLNRRRTRQVGEHTSQSRPSSTATSRDPGGSPNRASSGTAGPPGPDDDGSTPAARLLYLLSLVRRHKWRIAGALLAILGAYLFRRSYLFKRWQSQRTAWTPLVMEMVHGGDALKTQTWLANKEIRGVLWIWTEE